MPGRPDIQVLIRKHMNEGTMPSNLYAKDPLKVKPKKYGITAHLDPKDLSDVIQRLDNMLRVKDRKKRKKILKKAAPIFEREIRSRAPVWNEVVHRYARRREGSKRSKARVEASYFPGNLKRSTQQFPYERTSDVHIGPMPAREAKQATKGTFAGFKTDGWYRHFVIRGTRFQGPNPYVDDAFMAARNRGSKILLDEFAKEIERLAKIKR